MKNRAGNTCRKREMRNLHESLVENTCRIGEKGNLHEKPGGKYMQKKGNEKFA